MSPQAAVKLITLLKKKPELTREAFEKHIEQVHAPLVLEVTPFLSHYVRNYIQHDFFTGTSDSDSRVNCDVVTEAYFATEEDFQKFKESTSNQDIRKRLAEDESKCLDMSHIQIFVVKSRGGAVLTDSKGLKYQE